MCQLHPDQREYRVSLRCATLLFCIARFARYARFLARCMFSGHSARPLCLCPSLSAVTFMLAYRELYEWRGEAVRKLDHKYCHIVVRLCFCIRHVLAPIRGESFSVGLRLAKITEICAKGLAPLRLAKTTEACAKVASSTAPRQDNGGLCYLPLAPKSLSGYPHLLPTESFMNGTARPCENSTTNTAMLPSDYTLR